MLEFVQRHKKQQLSPLDLAFDKQRSFILDPSRMKVLFCTRRASKSFTAGIYAFHTALAHPGCNVALIGLTRQSAKGIFWKDILKELDKRLGTNARFNASELTVTLDNGSVIWITGIDANEDQMNKLLGQKYRLVCLDEGSMYSINLQVFTALVKPALADYAGTLCMMGTSSNITRGLFFDASRGAEPGWSLHTWAAYDNPHMADAWAWEIAEIERDRPEFFNTALFRQHFLNDWVIDESALVYKYDQAKNLARHLPVLRPTQSPWQHVLGVDLGSNDATAFTVGAFNEEDKKLYVVYSYKKSGMDFTDVANKVKELDKTYNFNLTVVDGANKQGVQEMNNRHGLSLLPAEKTAKADYVRLLNDDLVQGNVLLLPQAHELAKEWSELVWCTDITGKVMEPRKENPNLDNHLADSFLYLWRRCYQYLSQKPKSPPKQGTAEWGKAEEEKMWEHELAPQDDDSPEWGRGDWD